MNGSVRKRSKGRSGRGVRWRSCKGQVCASQAFLCLVGQFRVLLVVSSKTLCEDQARA